jgi:predicted nucleotide-binding protein
VDSIHGYYQPSLTRTVENVNELLYGKPKDRIEAPTDKTIFVVHGHDQIRYQLSHWLGQQKLGCFFLDDKSDESMTIIQKLEQYAPSVTFVIVLMTADDLGRSKDEINLTPRARQNVILELGYFIAKIGRKRVHVAAHTNIEIPSDWLGVLNSRIINGKLDLEKIR